MKFVLITSRFNEDVTLPLKEETLKHLPEGTSCYEVAGALELPLAAQQVAKAHKPDAIICLGAVIKGESDHYDYVCEHSASGIMRVNLDCSVPVINGVLTLHNKEQGLARIYKGKEFADTAREMAQLLSSLNVEENCSYIERS